MASASFVGNILRGLSDSLATGAGLNLFRTADNLINTGNTKGALELLRRAARNKKFGGELDAVEVAMLKQLTEPLKDVAPMGVAEYKALSAASKKMPLRLEADNFPTRMSEQGFVPLTGVNINNPSLTIKEYVGPTRERFIDEGARNLVAAVNLDPQAAQQYAKFYERTRDQLAATGAPLENIGGAWATLSAQADPVWNAELLRRIVRDPSQLVTSEDNQRLALRFLAGQIDEPMEVLGRGKRYNFMMNSIRPDDPRFLTADTRYAQNLQGVKNTYADAPFAGMFSPHESTNRYGRIYVEPGIEAARRLGMTPGQTQAAAWGNWRNKMFGIENDLPEDLLVDLADMNYNPGVYRSALDRLVR
jgi:hypothetical protein